MKFALTICVIVLLSYNGNTQEVKEQEETSKSESLEIAQNEAFLSQREIILTLDLSEQSNAVIDQLRVGFDSFNEKIHSIDMDESTKVMVVNHSGHLKKSEVMILLESYSIGEDAIISYN